MAFLKFMVIRICSVVVSQAVMIYDQFYRSKTGASGTKRKIVNKALPYPFYDRNINYFLMIDQLLTIIRLGHKHEWTGSSHH